MGIRCGIVGLPNVGKSTLFNALTGAGALAESYPFATVDKNVGVAEVPDPRLAAISAIVNPREIVPTAIEFVDVAGLVAGASHGEGLGNTFLGHIREVDAIAHVVRCFDDPDVSHVGDVNPRDDIDTVNTELILADLGTVERSLERLTRKMKSGDRATAAAVTTVERLEQELGAGVPARAVELSDIERPVVRDLFLLTSKPMMYIANVGDEGASASTNGAIVANMAQAEGAVAVSIAGRMEAEIAELEPGERIEFLVELGETRPGLDRVINAAHELLGLNTFFTSGEKQVRAWTYRGGMTASQCAGIIHTDFERGFIRAEVISYDDFVTLGGEPGAKEAGRWRLEGRDYPMAEGDVVLFRFNV